MLSSPIRRLSERAAASRVDFTDIRTWFPVDQRRLYSETTRDLTVLALPMRFRFGLPVAYLSAFAFDVVGFSLFTFAGGWLLAVGLAMLVGAFYWYPTGEAEAMTVLEFLTDVYASPVDGDRVKLTVEGWHFRGTSPWTGLRRLTTGERSIEGFVHLGSSVGAGLAILLGVGLILVPTVL